MKIRQWIAVILAASLLPTPFAFGEELQDQAKPVPAGSDVSDEIVSSEASGKDTAGGNFPETPSGRPEESMIFVFETTGQEENPGDEEETEPTDESPEMIDIQADTENEAFEGPDVSENDPENEDTVIDEAREEEKETTGEAPVIPDEPEAEEETGPDAVEITEATETEACVQAEAAAVPDEPEAEEETGPEADEMTEATEAEASVQPETVAIPEETEAADEEPAEMTESETFETDEGMNESEEPETAMPEGKLPEKWEGETVEPDEASTESEEPVAETEMSIPEGEPMEIAEQEAVDANESLIVPEEPETEAENTILTGINEEKQPDDEMGSTGVSAEISELAITPVETNNRYCQMTFSFTAEGREYSCLVTGLAETGSNSEAAWQQLAEDIAASFLAGEIFTLSEAGAAAQYDLRLDLIDAEKISKRGSDSNICWAASTADMLEYAGWNKAEDEDATFQEFREEFNNRGGYQSIGISWYLNGVNPYQASYQSGNIAYGNDLKDSAAQQQNAGTGGYWNDYAAAKVSEEYDERLTEQLEEAADKLTEGYGVGLGSYFYRDQETITAGHALTVFGYIREKLEEAAAAIRALFISDSDDRANGTQTNAADYPDEYVMYQTPPFENSSISSVQLVGYNTRYTTAIGIVSTLAPQKTAESELEGTKNAVQDTNLIPTGMRIEDADGVELAEAEPGTTITVGTEFKNQSYKKLPKNAVIWYTVKIYRDGDLVDEVEKCVNTDSKDGLKPNRSVEESLQVTLEKSGEYTFETQVIEITTEEGISIPEAYVSDNLYRGTARVIIPGGTEEEAQEKRPNEPDPPEDDPRELLPEPPGPIRAENTANGEKSGETIYTLTVVLATDTEYVLDFDAAAAAPESFTRLRNRKTGETVDPENYRIIRRAETGYSITFEEDFIRTLKPGKNDFTLTWNMGRVLIRIIIM